MRPLSPTAIEAATLKAEAVFAHRCAPTAGDEFARLGMLLVVASAIGCDHAELAELLFEHEIDVLFLVWARHQAKCTPDTDKLSNWLRRRVNDDPDIMMDAARAWQLKSPTEFYGQPSVDLTEGQMAYWQLANSAFNEFHIPDSRGRMKTATKSWLNQSD